MMAEKIECYKVPGGWHASMPELSITCFGATEGEALAALQASLKRSVTLRDAARSSFAFGLDRPLEAAIEPSRVPMVPYSKEPQP